MALMRGGIWNIHLAKYPNETKRHTWKGSDVRKTVFKEVKDQIGSF